MNPTLDIVKKDKNLQTVLGATVGGLVGYFFARTILYNELPFVILGQAIGGSIVAITVKNKGQ